MKSIITLLLSFVLINNISSQSLINIDTTISNELPNWFIHNGDTVGIVFSIEQVQKMDSDLELLYWLEKKGFTCDSTISVYVRVIDDYGKQITILKTTVSELSSQVDDKDSQIKNLKNQVSGVKKELNLANIEIENYKKIVENDNKRIRNLKTQRNLSIAGGAILTTAATLITYFILSR